MACAMGEGSSKARRKQAGGNLATICLPSGLSRVRIPRTGSLDASLQEEAGSWCLVCPPGGFPGGSYLLAASRPGPTWPPPTGKPSADSCWPSPKMRVHVSRDAGTCGVSGEGKPPRFCLECRWRAWANPRSIQLPAFSRLLSRRSPLSHHPHRLRLWCADGTSSA
jgi:hypothetical protein